MKHPIIYVSYDGMLEPLGQSQVLAYLDPLSRDRAVHLISFEKPADWNDSAARARVQARIKAAGIHWHPRRYHKTPSALATAYDIVVGLVSTLWLVVRLRRAAIIHARSDVPALMAWPVARLTGAKFIFDMRGFWADERVDGDLWPRGGRLYRLAKWFERKFLLSADHVVSLTHAAVREMARYPWLKDHMPPMTVIPTCVDLDRFRRLPRMKDDFVVGYVGSVRTWYLFDEVIAAFRAVRALRPEARLLIVNRNEHAYVRERLEAAEVEPAAFELRAALHDEVPALMSQMDVSIFFIKPVYSKMASAPTKLGEFLGCGIPCWSNSGVGDMTAVLEDEHVGIATSGFDEGSFTVGAERLLRLLDDPDVRNRCVRTARKHFSLEQGVDAYRAIYAAIDAA